MHLPSFEPLDEIAHRFESAKVTFALGGSGLMHALGLIDTVQDWDITTDCPLSIVEPCLAGLDYQIKQADGIFATQYRCKISMQQAVIDLMGGFAIQSSQGIVPIPTIVTGTWKDIPLGSPEAWALAYQLMGRLEKADSLRNFLKR